MAGKGDKPRNCFSKQFKDNYDHIFRKTIAEWMAIYSVESLSPVVDLKERISETEFIRRFKNEFIYS